MTLLVFCVKASAIPIFYSDGSTVTKVKTLPQSEVFEITTTRGNTVHCDLGVMHDQFCIFGIPVWNYGVNKYVLYHDNSDTFDYVELTKEDIADLQSFYPDIPSTPELPFWDTVGGKIVVLIIILVIGFVLKIFEGAKQSESDDE